MGVYFMYIPFLFGGVSMNKWTAQCIYDVAIIALVGFLIHTTHNYYWAWLLILTL